MQLAFSNTSRCAISMASRFPFRSLNLPASSRLTTTTTEFYQSPPESSTKNFSASQENPFSAVKVNSSIETATNNFSNPFMAQQSMTILSEQMKRDDLAELNGTTTGNGYQKLPFHLPPSSTYETDAVDHQLTAKLNRMLYTQSPQLPRKTYEFNANTANIIQQTNIPSQLVAVSQHHQQPMHHPQQPLQMQFHQPSQVTQPHLHQPSSQLHHIGNQSPFMPRKFAHNEPEYGTHYSPYKPLPLPQQQQPQSTFSPVIRKRYQEGHLVSEDLEFRILHGNTSPIVLQRFYHQQNQLKDQKEEDQLRAMRTLSSSPNPFKGSSSIPVRSDGSPLPNARFQHHPQAQLLQRNVMHHEPSYNASQKIYESHIPQLQTRMVPNGNGIPYRHHLQQQQPLLNQHHPYQPMYDNVAHRAQMACPGSPQLDRLRANLEKPNFYERHQKLPVEIESYQHESSLNQSNGLNDSKNKDKGMSANAIEYRRIPLNCLASSLLLGRPFLA